MRRLSIAVLAAAAMVSLAACDDSTSGPAPITAGTISFNANGDSTFLVLGDTALERVTDPADRATSTAWDLFVLNTTVRSNSGAMGPGNVGVFCVCQNEAALTDTTAVLAMTAVSELPDFAAVTAASLAAATFATNDSTFIQYPWYRYNYDGQHTISPTFNVYLVQSGTRVFKIQIIGYYDQSGASRYYTIRYEKLAD